MTELFFHTSAVFLLVMYAVIGFSFLLRVLSERNGIAIGESITISGDERISTIAIAKILADFPTSKTVCNELVRHARQWNEKEWGRFEGFYSFYCTNPLEGGISRDPDKDIERFREIMRTADL